MGKLRSVASQLNRFRPSVPSGNIERFSGSMASLCHADPHALRDGTILLPESAQSSAALALE